MRSADHHLTHWFDRLRADLPDLLLYDAHTHIGRNDPDGFKQTAEQLLDRLAQADARAVFFPMHEPDGYRDANDEVIEVAAAHADRLVAYCRVDPAHDAVAEATRALDAGARGIKLHPRAEQFTMHHEGVRPLAALAHERNVPILIHAGRGIPALGTDTLTLAADFPDARFILAHAAISDLSWMYARLPEHPNVLIDTSWWNPSDLLAVFALVAPGQVLFASDSPYGSPVQATVVTLRCALQAGLDERQVRGVAGETMARLLDTGELSDLGPAPGGGSLRADPILDRVADNIVSCLARRVIGDDGLEPLSLARLCCDLPEGHERGPVAAAILDLIDRSEAHRALPEDERLMFSDLHVLATALCAAKTPDVALPAA
jgi:uncharacterized protein